MFENIAKYMFKHWMGTFFNKNSGENNGLCVLNMTIWNEIGNLMHKARKTFPSYLGRHLEILFFIMLVIRQRNGQPGLQCIPYHY